MESQKGFNLRVAVALVGIVACVAFGAMHFGSAKSQAEQAGSLLCRSPVWDAGLLDSNEDFSLEHRFLIENVSDAEVHISNIQTSCGCLILSESPKSIAAKGSAEIPVRIRLPQATTQLVHRIEILQESFDAPLLLTVKGLRIPKCSFICYPSSINFGTVGMAGVSRRIVRVRRSTGTPIENCKVVSSSDCVLAKVESNGEGEIRIAAELNAASFHEATDVLNARLLLTTDGTECREWSIDVVARFDRGS